MKRFLTSKEAADYIGISEAELQKLIDKGKVHTYKIGGIYTRFKVDDLGRFRRRGHTKRAEQKLNITSSDKIKDFFYFNDFYIAAAIVVIVILYFIFK